ncbi:hypothetical protein [Butyrivibrio sp. LC3010]|uniref:hypothetical protein n=1 Tax=Butyrivibrio sp. LC3010 TaxID=1280680 RepID=UPI0003FA903F|nr:hypothetical protein [Butyrivibrio sp. LC3010]
MKSNILAFFFTMGSIVMAVFIVWFYNMSDKNPPEMRFSSLDMVYDGTTKEADLLNGVMAYDAVDGDITDRIVVEKTILNKEQSSAVVYYAVSDRSGNVTKQSRIFNANIAELDGLESGVMTDSEGFGSFSGEASNESFGQGGFDTEGYTQYSEDSEEETSESESQGENSENGESGDTQESGQTGN